MFSNMSAKLLFHERHQLETTLFVEMKVWRVPTPVRGSSHDFRYSLALVSKGECALRFDNEAGKGDHFHIGELERSYRFISAERLLADFWRQVDEWRQSCAK